MKSQLSNLKRVAALAIGVIASVLVTASVEAQNSDELQQLKQTVQQMQQTIGELNRKIATMETNRPATMTTTTTTTVQKTSPSVVTIEKIAAGEQVAHQSPIAYRGALDDKQEAASRPKDFTLDPTFNGFFPIPNTPVLLKFNPKPHLDLTFDNENPGSKYRFVPAKFPLRGDPDFGGGRQTFVNANATQLRIDARAPELPGDLRFYYQNDFFGSDSGDMKYRLQHLYGQFYGVKAGFTYGVWEDPDSWPDTVDYEGPNAVIFARRAVAQYTYAWSENWNTTFGIEKPDTFIDLSSGPNPGVSTLTRIPDLGFNTRFEKKGFGHVQFSTIFRDLGAKDGLGNDHHTLGWGVNLGGGIELGECDSIQLLGVYGHGVGGMGNDTSFLNSDAAFDSGGDLEALPYWSAMAGYTHRWSPALRSTVTYGYVNLDTTSGQAGTFYEFSHYASANIIWQLRKRLSVGFEGLYGFKEARNGTDSGDHWRLQVGLVYSLFD